MHPDFGHLQYSIATSCNSFTLNNLKKYSLLIFPKLPTNHHLAPIYLYCKI